MPIIKSAKKALRSSAKKRARNEKFKVELKAAIKKADAKNLDATYSKIDKAVKKNLIHKNKAARLKSRLAKKLSQAKPTTKTKKVVKKVAKKTTKKVTRKVAKK